MRTLWPTRSTKALARDAVKFLRNQWLTLEPRKKWPNMTNIPPAERAEPGQILCLYGDGGWGGMVREQKEAGEFDKRLIDALVELVEEVGSG